jgi:hypothetical protein
MIGTTGPKLELFLKKVPPEPKLRRNDGGPPGTRTRYNLLKREVLYLMS